MAAKKKAMTETGRLAASQARTRADQISAHTKAKKKKAAKPSAADKAAAIFDLPAEADLTARVVDAAEGMGNLQALIDPLEEELKSLKSRLHLIRTGLLPDLMTEARMTSVTTENGRIYELTDLISGSIPNEAKDPIRHAAAIAWLEDNDAEGLIKSVLTASFGRSQHDVAKEIAASISNRCDPSLSESVHPQSLAAFARQRIKDGEPIDLAVIGLSSIKIVKVKEKKK